MKKLVLLPLVAALASPAVASAKGALGAELCGPDGCSTQKYAVVHEDANGPFSGLGGIAQPAAPGPWFRGSVLLGEPNGKVFGRIPFFYVPGADMMVQPGDAKQQPAWWRPQGELAAIVHSLARKVRPFAAPRDVQVTVDGKAVGDPESYLRLYTVGKQTFEYPRSDRFVQIVYSSKTYTPWTTHNNMVLYVDDHLLMRDGQIVALSPSLTDRAASGTSLDTHRALPWLQLLGGLAAIALVALLLARVRPRPAPQTAVQA